MRWALLIPPALLAQYFTPRLLGTAEAQAPVFHDPLTANPASAFPMKKYNLTAVTAFYLPAPELQFYCGGGSLTWDSLQSVHVLLQQWRFDKIAQTEAGAGYALRLLQHRLILSVRGRLLSTNFSEYGRLYRGSPDVGFIFQAGQRLVIGGYGYNLLAQGWGFLPGQIRYGAGIAYMPAPTARVITELSHVGGERPRLHTAFVYSVHPVLVLRGGVALPLLQVGGGFSIRYRQMAMDAGYTHQPAVGSRAAVGITFPD